MQTLLNVGGLICYQIHLNTVKCEKKLQNPQKWQLQGTESKNARKEVNLQLKKEIDFYDDMIIVPFMDHYELVVLKTLAIYEYGVQNISAKYIMKCDDDTFVRVDTILKEIKSTPHKHG